MNIVDLLGLRDETLIHRYELESLLQLKISLDILKLSQNLKLHVVIFISAFIL